MAKNIMVNEATELISIIIPVFNVEKYLESCIDSILCQTYPNLEIILIDDGSTDASAAICDRYAKEYSMIKVMHKKNNGAGAARNDGMELAEGTYIAFVDSDDFIGRNYIEGLYYTLKKYNADISMGGCTHISEESDRRNFDKMQEDKDIRSKETHTISGRDGLRGKIVLPCGEEVPWGRLYKKSLFIKFGIIFPVGLGYEDTATIYKLIYYAKIIACIDMKEYYYRIRKNSLMHSAFSVKNLDRIISQESKCKFFWEKQEHEMLVRNLNCYCKVVRECYDELQQEYHGEDKKYKKSKIINDLRKNLKLYSQENISILKRFYYWGFAYLPFKSLYGKLYCWVFRK